MRICYLILNENTPLVQENYVTLQRQVQVLCSGITNRWSFQD